MAKRYGPSRGSNAGPLAIMMLGLTLSENHTTRPPGQLLKYFYIVKIYLRFNKIGVTVSILIPAVEANRLFETIRGVFLMRYNSPSHVYRVVRMPPRGLVYRG